MSMYLNGLWRWRPLERLQASVRECGLGLRPGLYVGSVCDDSTAEAAVVALYKKTLLLLLPLRVNFRIGPENKCSICPVSH